MLASDFVQLWYVVVLQGTSKKPNPFSFVLKPFQKDAKQMQPLTATCHAELLPRCECLHEHVELGEEALLLLLARDHLPHQGNMS